MRSYLSIQVIIKLVIIFIFFIIVKEILLINEELLLIFSFTFFVYSTYSVFSYLLNQELQNYITIISVAFSDLLETKKKNLTGLLSFYRYIIKIKALILRSSVFVKIKLEIIEKNNAVQLFNIRKIIVNEQLCMLMAEEVKLIKSTNMCKFKYFDIQLSNEPIEEFTTMVLDISDEEEEQINNN